MGKTPASTRRAGRKSKPKNSERKWCTCQERCRGGKDVAASTYRSHNQTPVMPADARDGGRAVGGKRKAVDDEGGLDPEGRGIRETRRMRAKRIARNEETESSHGSSPMVVDGPIEILELADVQTRPQKTKKVEGFSRILFRGTDNPRPPPPAGTSPRGSNPRIPRR